jgi:hypothetical protein
MEMSRRGTSNSPNTRNPERPASKPGRLDQFADDMFGKEKDTDEGVTSRKEKRKWLKLYSHSKRQIVSTL